MRGRSFHEYREFAEAAVLLTGASIAISLLPFRFLTRAMGNGDPSASVNDPDPLVTRLAVKRASRRLPWKTVCFQEGLAAHWMLRRRGLPSRLHYGIRHQGGKLTAHVWVEVRGQIVIGEEELATAHHRVAIYPDALPTSQDGG